MERSTKSAYGLAVSFKYRYHCQDTQSCIVIIHTSVPLDPSSLPSNFNGGGLTGIPCAIIIACIFAAATAAQWNSTQHMSENTSIWKIIILFPLITSSNVRIVRHCWRSGRRYRSSASFVNFYWLYCWGGRAAYWWGFLALIVKVPFTFTSINRKLQSESYSKVYRRRAQLD